MVQTRMPTSTKHNTYVVNEKYEYFDDISLKDKVYVRTLAIPFYYEKLLD